jgi:hypothetical protein
MARLMRKEMLVLVLLLLIACLHSNDASAADTVRVIPLNAPRPDSNYFSAGLSVGFPSVAQALVGYTFNERWIIRASAGNVGVYRGAQINLAHVANNRWYDDVLISFGVAAGVTSYRDEFLVSKHGEMPTTSVETWTNRYIGAYIEGNYSGLFFELGIAGGGPHVVGAQPFGQLGYAHKFR